MDLRRRKKKQPQVDLRGGLTSSNTTCKKFEWGKEATALGSNIAGLKGKHGVS